MAFGLTTEAIRHSVESVHRVLDRIDDTLLDATGERLAQTVELANLSAILGNLFRKAVVQASDGAFAANAPHTYPDLLGVAPGCCDVEIKVALETNKPKGHLIKPGPHLIVRYVLAHETGAYARGKRNRGDVVWIWEVRAGRLGDAHFNFSNSEGDSGKTAVVNALGMDAMDVVYCDLGHIPHAESGKAYAKLAALFR